MTDVWHRDTPGLPLKVRKCLHLYRLTGFVGEVIRHAMAYVDQLETRDVKATYELTINCSCPVDGRPDTYQTVVRTHRMIPVELILAEAEKLRGQKVYQEQLTQDLAVALGAEVETVGWHSGVRVTCVAAEAAPPLTPETCRVVQLAPADSQPAEA